MRAPPSAPRATASRAGSAIDWVVGYGSLTDRCGGRGWRAVRLSGFARCWGVAMDNRVDLPGYKHYTLDGRRPDCHVAFLDVVSSRGSVLDAVAFPVAGGELAELDARERNYERLDVSDRVSPSLPGRAWLYRGSAEARARCRRAGERGDVVVDAAYLAGVREGLADLLGRDGGVPAPPFPDLSLRRHDLP